MITNYTSFTKAYDELPHKAKVALAITLVKTHRHCHWKARLAAVFNYMEAVGIVSRECYNIWGPWVTISSRERKLAIWYEGYMEFLDRMSGLTISQRLLIDKAKEDNEFPS